jgi:hypothetical protein
MAFETNQYLGAFVRLKSKLNLSQIIGKNTVHRDRLSQIDMSDWVGKPSNEFVCIGNHFDNTSFRIEEEGCLFGLYGQEYHMKRKIDNFRYFYNDVIEFLEAEIGKENVIIDFGYILYIS